MTMTPPFKTTYDLGRDRFGRKLELTIERGAMTLFRHAGHQRDDELHLEITPDQARATGRLAPGGPL